MFWHIVWMVLLGLVVGWIARLIVPGKHKMGLILTAILGIVGGYVGGTLGSLVFAPHQLTFTAPIKHSFFGALIGAVILLFVYGLVRGSTRKT